MKDGKCRMCVNGCNKPVQKPSKVLCKECLSELNKKFESLNRFFEEKRLNLNKLKEE